jgi:hypothetical protein
MRKYLTLCLLTAAGISFGSMAQANIVIPTGSYTGSGVLVASQVQQVPYTVAVKIAKAAGVYTWTQTFHYANGQIVTNVFVATLDETTGFIKITSVNGVAQQSSGYCAKDTFTSGKLECTLHWQQNGAPQVDAATFHTNGKLSQFGSDQAIDLVWHDLSSPN